MSEQTRGYIYRILTAVVPLLITYGVLDDHSAPLWIALGAAVLGTGLASANTSTSPQ